MRPKFFTSISAMLLTVLFSGPAVASLLTDSFHKQIVDDKSITKITLDNVNGNCHFFPVAKGKRITVNATLTIKGASDEACERYYRKVRIMVNREKGKVTIVVNRPRNRLFFGMMNSVRMTVDFEISVPRSLDVAVNLVNGDVAIEGMKDCAVDLVNGDINMTRISGVSIDAVNSCITISDVGKWVAIDAVNGRLKLLSSSSGLEKVKVEFVNGNMTVQIPARALARLNMDSETGGTMFKVRDGKQGWETRMRGKRIHISDRGGAVISLKNVNGKIVFLSD